MSSRYRATRLWRGWLAGVLAWIALPALAAGIDPAQWPRDASGHAITAVVWLLADVSADGKVMRSRVWRSSGYPLFDTAARTTLAHWQLKPRRVNGRAVSSEVRVPVLFQPDPAPTSVQSRPGR